MHKQTSEITLAALLLPTIERDYLVHFLLGVIYIWKEIPIIYHAIQANGFLSVCISNHHLSDISELCTMRAILAEKNLWDAQGST